MLNFLGVYSPIFRNCCKRHDHQYIRSSLDSFKFILKSPIEIYQTKHVTLSTTKIKEHEKEVEMSLASLVRALQ